jgi:hypothetical protein
MNSLHDAFKLGARKLALANAGEYGSEHRSHGISPEDWRLLTQAQYWTPEETRQIRSILANVVEVCVTLSGMPAISLPGQYVAAVIANVVAPANRMIACTKVPDTFDGIAASGVMGTMEVKPMEIQQMMALVMVYSADFYGEPPAEKLPREVVEIKKKGMAK